MGQSAPFWFVAGVLARALFDEWLSNHAQPMRKKRAKGEE